MDSEPKNIDNQSQEEVQEEPRKRLEDRFATKNDLCQFIYNNGLTQLKEAASGCETTPFFKIIRKEIQQREKIIEKYAQLDKDDKETIELKFQRKMISKDEAEMALGFLARREAAERAAEREGSPGESSSTQ